MKNNIDRREFLRSSAATAGGLALGTGMIPESAREKPKPKEDKLIRLGFIGVGDRGSYHLDSALGIEGGSIIPVVPSFPVRSFKKAYDNMIVITGDNDIIGKIKYAGPILRA